jgi:predicted PurR-regulated permease PerM
MTTSPNGPRPAPSPGSSAPELSKLHLWEIQPLRDLLLLASLLGILYLGYVLRPVTVPLLLAMMLAYLFEPLVKRLTRSGRFSRPGVAIGIILAALVLVVAPVTVGAGFAAVQGASYAGTIAGNISGVRASLEDPTNVEAREKLPPRWLAIRDRIERIEQVRHGADGDHPARATGFEAQAAELIDMAVAWIDANAASVARTIGRRALGTGADAALAAISIAVGLGKVVMTLVLTAFFFFFLSTGWGKVLGFWESLIPERRKGSAVAILAKMDRVIAGFVRGRLTIAAIVTVYYTLAYWLIGVPAPLVLGPIVGLLVICPFGHGLGMPVAMLLMWLQPVAPLGDWQTQWWWVVFAPIGCYFGAQIIDDWLLTPTIQGKNVNMDVPTILFASLAGAILAGLYGVLIAIPTAACVKILLDDVVWPRVGAWARGDSPDPLPWGRK